MTTGVPDLDHGRLRRRLVTELVASGAVRSPAWREAFEHVPRHQFVPRFYQPVAGTSGYAPVDSADSDQRDAWAAGVYTNDALVTQVDGDDSRWEAAARSPVGRPALAASRR